MFCMNCGQKINDNAESCPHCLNNQLESLIPEHNDSAIKLNNQSLGITKSSVNEANKDRPDLGEKKQQLADGFNGMKSIGILIASISSLCLLIALNMSTTVTTAAMNIAGIRVPGVTVHNLGLMQDKQNYITVSAVFLIIGLALYLFCYKNDTRVPKENNALLKKIEISGNLMTENSLKFSSAERNLDNDAYKLYLVKKYKITKNEVLNQFVLNNKLYETLGEVLNIAHNVELQEAIELEEKLSEISKKISALSDQAKSDLDIILRNGYKLEEMLIKNNSLVWVFLGNNDSRFEIKSIEKLNGLASKFK